MKPKCKYMKGGPKCKFIEGTKLSKTNKRKMMTHSDHHTLKHIKFMTTAINAGKTFAQSHKIALKKIGK